MGWPDMILEAFLVIWIQCVVIILVYPIINSKFRFCVITTNFALFPTCIFKHHTPNFQTCFQYLIIYSNPFYSTTKYLLMEQFLKHKQRWKQPFSLFFVFKSKDFYMNDIKIVNVVVSGSSHY